jgi:hypothetical protein
MSTNVGRLLGNATKRTGLTDWGDTSFIEPLEMLLDSFETDGERADAITKESFRIEVMELLSTRLQVQRDLAEHPEILEVQISRPLVVVGLPRSGTSLLHNLLAQDPQCRYLAFWEVVNPSPPPESLTWADDRRIRRAEERLRRLGRRMSGCIPTEHASVCAPQDCRGLFDYTFMSDFVSRWPVRSYQLWLQSQNKATAYQYYRDLLKLLTWHCHGSHLVLMSPSHLPHLDLLLNVLPDANVVWLHRDLAAVIPAMCRLRSTMRGSIAIARSGGLDVLRTVAHAVRDAMAVRERQPQERFHDVMYDELISAPHDVVKHIYEAFGYPWPDGMGASIIRWLEQHPTRRHGARRRPLPGSTLDPETVARELPDYTQRFGVHGHSKSQRTELTPIQLRG